MITPHDMQCPHKKKEILRIKKDKLNTRYHELKQIFLKDFLKNSIKKKEIESIEVQLRKNYTQSPEFIQEVTQRMELEKIERNSYKNSIGF